jgi:hypothetical protein
MIGEQRSNKIYAVNINEFSVHFPGKLCKQCCLETKNLAILKDVLSSHTETFSNMNNINSEYEMSDHITVTQENAFKYIPKAKDKEMYHKNSINPVYSRKRGKFKHRLNENISEMKDNVMNQFHHMN